MTVLDLDLHGMLGIRLVDPGPADARAVAAQLGAARRTSLEVPPDLVIRFCERLDTGPLRLLGARDAAFTDDDFLVLKGKGKRPVRVSVPFEEFGPGLEIRCERGLPAVPLLVPLVNALFATKGVLALHASAFVHEGTGVLVTGWSKGGKTETLLAFMAAGARFVGDEWVHVTADDRRMYGLVEPVRVWDWHLQHLPMTTARLRQRDRLRLATLRRAVRVADWWAAAGPASLRGFACRGRALLQGQTHVDSHPSHLFPGRQAAAGVPVSQLYLVMGAEQEDIRVRPMEGKEIAARMAASLQYERDPLRWAYLQYRFAFPHRRSRLLEDVHETEEHLLTKTLAPLDSYELTHPERFRLPDLVPAMAPLIAGGGGS